MSKNVMLTMGNLQTAINDKAGTLESQNFLDADEQKRNAYNG